MSGPPSHDHARNLAKTEESGVLRNSIPGSSDYLDQAQISLLQKALDEAYLESHPAYAILTNQHPILATTDNVGELSYFSYGDMISKQAGRFTTENVSQKISGEFVRILSAIILSDQPIPNTISCYFAIHHGGHWTSLVLDAAIERPIQSYLHELREFFSSLPKPYSSSDRVLLENLLLLIGGKNTPNLIQEFLAQIKRKDLEGASFGSITDIITLIETLKTESCTHPQNTCFVPFYEINQITLMDSLNSDYCNNAIAEPLSSILPDIPIQRLAVPQQGPNHCGDNTIGNGFFYASTKRPCTRAYSQNARQLTILACKENNHPGRHQQSCATLAHALLENRAVPLPPAPNPIIPPIPPIPLPTPPIPNPISTIITPLPTPRASPSQTTNDFKSKKDVIQALNQYLSPLHWIKVVVVAVFSLNIFGLGLRKALMARQLKKELEQTNLDNQVIKILSDYDNYNTYLEDSKPLWLENFKPIHPEKNTPDIASCSKPIYSAFFKALHH